MDGRNERILPMSAWFPPELLMEECSMCRLILAACIMMPSPLYEHVYTRVELAQSTEYLVWMGLGCLALNGRTSGDGKASDIVRIYRSSTSTLGHGWMVECVSVRSNDSLRSLHMHVFY